MSIVKNKAHKILSSALIISPIDEKASKLFVTAYKEGKILKNMTWNEVFGDEAMMKMMAKQ